MLYGVHIISVGMYFYVNHNSETAKRLASALQSTYLACLIVTQTLRAIVLFPAVLVVIGGQRTDALTDNFVHYYHVITYSIALPLKLFGNLTSSLKRYVSSLKYIASTSFVIVDQSTFIYVWL